MTDCSPEAIRGLRAALGLTQEAFADHLGVSISTVRDWEQDRRHPRGLYRKLIERELARTGKAAGKATTGVRWASADPPTGPQTAESTNKSSSRSASENQR